MLNEPSGASLSPTAPWRKLVFGGALLRARSSNRRLSLVTNANDRASSAARPRESSHHIANIAYAPEVNCFPRLNKK